MKLEPVHDKAIVTITIGRHYQDLWRQYSFPGWRAYADTHGFDLIQVTEHFDHIDPKFKTTPAWQKLFILSQPWSAEYKRIVWIDSDILINPDSPDVTDGIAPEMIGCTYSMDFPTNATEEMALFRLCRQLGGCHQQNLDYYKSAGLLYPGGRVVQTGVLVLSPPEHRHIFEAAQSYSQSPHYEMPALSYEILKNQKAFWIDQRFNATWAHIKALWYPWLRQTKLPASVCHRLGPLTNYLYPDWSRCIRAAYENSYFLHFAGVKDDMTLCGLPNGVDVKKRTL